MAGEVAYHWIRDVDHHWAGRIDHIVASAEIGPVALAPEGHRKIVPWVTRDGGLHPHYAPSAGITFQGRNSCRVRSDEVNERRVVPVKNNYSIIAEVNVCQVCWSKLGVSVTVGSDGILNYGKRKRIVSVEQREFIRRGLAESKRVLNRVASELCAPSDSRPAAG